MASRYDLLPATANHVEIYRICRQCIQQMHDHGSSYPKIAAEVTRYADGAYIGGPSLKTFMAREESKRINSKNNTLAAIYNYLSNEFNNLEPEIKGIIQIKWHVFNPGALSKDSDEKQIKDNLCHTISRLFREWVNTSEKDISRIRSKISGEYIMLRKSVIKQDMIVKSRIIIGDDGDKDTISIKHIHMDRAGVLRVSEGFVMPIVRNVYCIMEVEGGEGLDILVLKDPIQQKFVRMYGFCGSMNLNRKLLWAKTFLERDNEIWRSAPARFNIPDICKYPLLKDVFGPKELALLDKGTCPTLPEIGPDGDPYGLVPGSDENVGETPSHAIC